MKLRSKNNNTVIIIAIVAVVVVALIVAGVLLAPTIIGHFNKPDPSIAVSVSPKNVYFVGEKFDPTGLKIQVLMGDPDSSYFVSYPNSELKISGFDSSVANESLPLTITYKGMTTTLNVTIKDYPPKNPVLVDMKLSDNFYAHPFSYTVWNKNGPYKRANVNIVLIYDDGSEKEIPLTAEYCSNVDRNLTSAGTTEFTLHYTEGGVRLEKTITVTITE